MLKLSYRKKQRGGESQAAMMGKIPQGITEQGMNFQRMTSKLHRTRKMRKQRGGVDLSQPPRPTSPPPVPVIPGAPSVRMRQRGGALTPAPYESLGEVLPSSMTGPMTTAASGVLGGSATGPLDLALTQTRQLVQQHGGGKRNRSQKNRQQQNRNRNRQQQNRNRNRSQQNRNRNRQQQNRSRKQKQRGGALGYGEAVPASGNYTLLNPQELKAAGLNPQWFDENQVNPSFGGALTVPGGK